MDGFTIEDKSLTERNDFSQSLFHMWNVDFEPKILLTWSELDVEWEKSVNFVDEKRIYNITDRSRAEEEMSKKKKLQSKQSWRV